MRKANDFYPTETAVTWALLMNYPDINGVVGEICCGDGRMADVLAQWPGVSRVIRNDIVPGLGVHGYCDVSNPDAPLWERYEFDWIITNPPYHKDKLALIVRNSLAQARVGVAMLLRLTFLEPCRDRRDILSDCGLSAVMPLNPRPKFRADRNGSDKATVAWLVWDKRREDGACRFAPIVDWQGVGT